MVAKKGLPAHLALEHTYWGKANGHFCSKHFLCIRDLHSFQGEGFVFVIRAVSCL